MDLVSHTHTHTGRLRAASAGLIPSDCDCVAVAHYIYEFLVTAQSTLRSQNLHITDIRTIQPSSHTQHGSELIHHIDSCCSTMQHVQSLSDSRSVRWEVQRLQAQDPDIEVAKLEPQQPTEGQLQQLAQSSELNAASSEA